MILHLEKKELFTNGIWHVGIIENKRVRSHCLGENETKPEISPVYVTSLAGASTRQKGKFNFYLKTLSLIIKRISTRPTVQFTRKDFYSSLRLSLHNVFSQSPSLE